MFVEWPGDVKKSEAERAAAFNAKYPMVPAKRWKSLLARARKDDKAIQLLYEHEQPRPIAQDDKAAMLAKVGATSCSTARRPGTAGRTRRSGA